jgi:predicted O-methyltransferase YrrM
VLRNNKEEEIFTRIEILRQSCLRSKEIIQKTDYGESGENNPGRKYEVRISEIARTSLASPKHARRLYRLARHMKALTILEIGTSLGITTAYLAMANPDARIITLEGCPELCRIARENFKSLGLKNIDLLEGRFDQTLMKALQQLGTVDLAFIDGNHYKNAAVYYYEGCFLHSGNDTVLVFDDIHSSTGMEEAWEAIREKEDVKVSLDLFYSGWVFFRKESAKEHFRLRYI